jgi:hypothetical protein
MNLIDIAKKFPTEESCIAYFKAEKEKKGIVCRGCGSTEFYWSKIYYSHDCKVCKYRTTLRSGTIMESSKLPFHYWLYAMFLMTMTKKGISANFKDNLVISVMNQFGQWLIKSGQPWVFEMKIMNLTVL